MGLLSGYITYGPAFRSAQIEEKAIRLPPGCACLDGRTLLFLSDVHACDRMFPERAVNSLIAQIAALNPDMLLLGGDYAESAAWALRFFDLLSAVRPPLGIYAVLGNNDTERFRSGLFPLYERMLNAGVAPLADRIVRIRVQDTQISIAGLCDFKSNSPPSKSLFSRRDENALRILLAHYPHSIVCHLECAGVQPHLSLSGHTHGGQFSIGPLNPYSIGFERGMKGVPLPAVSGWVPVKGGQLLVSPGVGTSRLPFRIGVPPVIHRIRLMKQSSQADDSIK